MYFKLGPEDKGLNFKRFWEKMTLLLEMRFIVQDFKNVSHLENNGICCNSGEDDSDECEQIAWLVIVKIYSTQGRPID